MSIKTLALNVLAKSGPVPQTVPRGTPHGTRIERKSVCPDAVQVQGQRFGSHARLFPFIGKRVWTPLGVGELFTAYADTCEVVLNDKVFSVPTADVRPIQ